MGVTTAELSKMLEQGKVLSEDFLPRFAAQLQKELGGGAVAAAQTAQAAFARLGNTLRELAADVGTSILKILQPAATLLDSFLSKVTKARRENAELSRENAQAALAGTGLTLEQLTATERHRLDVQARLGVSARPGDPNREAVRADILRDAQERARRAEREAVVAAEEALSSSGPSLVPFAKQQEAISKLWKDLEKDTKAATAQLQLFGKADGLKIKKAELAETEKTAGKMAEVLAEAPGIFASIPPSITSVVDKTNTLLASQHKTVDALEAQERAQKKAASTAESAAKQAITDAKQLEAQRQQLIDQLVQGEPFKLRSPDLSDINADIAYFERQLTTATGPALDAVVIALANLYTAQQRAFGPPPEGLTQGINAMGDALAAANKELKAAVPAADDLHAAWTKLERTVGETQFDEARSKVKQLLDEQLRVFGDNEELKVLARQRASDELRQIGERETKHNEQELRKQRQEYERFAERVRDTLATNIFDLISGRFETLKDVLTSLRDWFFRIIRRWRRKHWPRRF